MHVVAYLRVSTDRQVEEGLGLDVQERAIHHWARENGHKIVGTYRDEGISGSNGIETRIGLAAALDSLSGQVAEGLVVYRLDRLARDLILQEQLLAEVKRSGCHAFSTSKSENHYLADDDADPSRKLIRQVLGAVAEYERKMIAMRLSAGRKRKADSGGFAYGAPPFGYRAEKGRLVEVPEEQKVIEEIAELREQGHSLQAIADILNHRGHTTKRGGRWHSEIVRKVIRRLPSKVA